MRLSLTVTLPTRSTLHVLAFFLQLGQASERMALQESDYTIKSETHIQS